MLNNKLINELKIRNLIKEIINEKKLINKLNNKKITLYCGFDPTAKSLHLGHLIPLICLKRFQLAGHRPLILIGGATSLIGDPSFLKKKRKLIDIKKIKKYTKQIKNQILNFLTFNSSNNSAVILNNFKWFNKINLLDFLQNIGKYFFVNQMIKKDIIKNSIDNISFTEFSYILLQSYDFFYLNKKYKTILQIGGSDQWSNIISGIYLIKRLLNKNVFGLTLSLITKSDGTKFSKSEDNKICLNPNKTNSYKFYQYWLNTNDKNIYNFLKLLTLLDIIYINTLKKINKKLIQIPYAKYILSEELTRMVHGAQKLTLAKNITNNLFKGLISNLKKYDFYQLKKGGLPTIYINKKINKINLQEVLIITKLAKSRNQARKMIKANAITINEKKCNTIDYFFKDNDKLYKKFTLLKKGKKNYFLIYWE